MSTALAVADFRYTGSPAFLSRGSSEVSQFITKKALEGFESLKTSTTYGQMGKKSLNDLRTQFEECRYPDWDGYSALPVIERTYLNAIQFLAALPLGTKAPDIGAEPDGQLTLEWYRSPRRTLSVSISPFGELHYAALIGASRSYGTEPFYGEVPEAIRHLIYRVML